MNLTFKGTTYPHSHKITAPGVSKPSPQIFADNLHRITEQTRVKPLTETLMIKKPTKIERIFTGMIRNLVNWSR